MADQQSKAMVSVSDDEVADLSARLEMICARTNKNAEEIRALLKELNARNAELAKKHRDNACMRIRTIQADALVRKFTGSIGAFESTENSIQLKSRDLLVRRFQIIQPASQLTKWSNPGGEWRRHSGKQMFCFLLAGAPAKNWNANWSICGPSSMQRLEKSILALNKMFLDMQNLVLAQDDQLNHVQAYVERTVEFQKRPWKELSLKEHSEGKDLQGYRGRDIVMI